MSRSSNPDIGLSADAHDDAISHFRRRLAASAIETTPCRHSYVEQALPDSYYAAILKFLPASDDWRLIPHAGAYEAICSARLGVSGKRYDRWPAEWIASPASSGCEETRNLQIAFWRNFAERLADPAFINELGGTFLCEPDQHPLQMAIRLVQETGAACIPPHRDMAHKRLTIVFYLSGCEQDSLQGTSLYEVDAVKRVPKLRKTIPFAPNSAFVLPRTEDSWHGVEPHLISGSRTTLHLYLHGDTGTGVPL